MTTRSMSLRLVAKDEKEVLKDEQQHQLRRSVRLSKDNSVTKPVVDKNTSTLTPIKFKGFIKFTDDFSSCAQICDVIIQQVENDSRKIIPIGFDIEWPFSFQTGSGKTALVQICLEETTCYLFHIYKFKKLPAVFCALLNHLKVKLVGVNIKNDIRKIGRDFKEFPDQKIIDNNCIDSGPFVNQVYSRCGRWSLQRLTAFLLEKSLVKDNTVRMSKWHITPLSNAQKIYAATDAYVSLLIHKTIENKAVESEALKENTTLKLLTI